jgi:hypothetical protein
MLDHSLTLTAASRQWASRPADERFTSLFDMRDAMKSNRDSSRERVLSSRDIEAMPTADDSGLLIATRGGEFVPTHWAFGQIAQRADAPAAYLRKLPAPMAADAINYGLRFLAPRDEIQLLSRGDDLRAATGARYGRIWNSDVVGALTRNVGDGVTGDWRVPGEFGKAVEITRENTTLFAGDRDMFVFLADESRRIEIDDRRDGRPGSLARGFFVWNSEEGARTFGIATFLFDYVCSNRIVWGAKEYKEIKIRHSALAPERFLQEIAPALQSYTESSDRAVIQTIAAAQGARIGDADDVREFLAKRFGPRRTTSILAAHELEEGRPVSTLWDAVTGATAVARSIAYQDDRVELEREAGRILDLVAA